MGNFDSPASRGIFYGLPGGAPRDPAQTGWGDGGVLGGAPKLSGWDIASIIGSGLQDAYAGYRGQSGGNIDEVLGTIAKRALLAGLNSSDPAVRQRTYQQAALHGIDSKPFQQQQASQQLPGMLASMQTQPFAPGQLARLQAADPNYSGPTSTPGQSITEAISGAPPELQNMYAPKLIDSQISEAAKVNDAPSGYNKTPDGSLKFIPGGPADPTQVANMAGGRHEPPPGYVATPDGKGLTYIPGGPADPRFAATLSGARAKPKVLAPGGMINPSSLFGPR